MSDTSRPARAGYVTAIDGLRAIAVLSVMACHLDARWLPGGFTGVDVFFVISGFVVTLSMQDLRFATLRGMVIFFYARRLRRIAPALIVMLVAASLATVAFVPNAWLSETIQSTGIAAFFGLSNVVLSAQTEHYFAPSATFNTFLHTWSLGVEEQFYVLFPFLIAFVTIERLRRGRRLAVAALVSLSLASLVLCVVLTRRAPVFAFYQLPTRFWELGLGMALALSRERWSAALGALPGPAQSALAALGIAGLALTFALGNDQAFPYPWAISPVLATGLLIAVVTAAETSPAARALSTPVFAFVGKISYSLYLWHWPVYVIFRWTIGLDAPVPRLVAIVLVFALSIASYLYVEQPFRHGARWRRLPRGAIVAAGLGALLVSAGVARAAFALTSTLSFSTTRLADVWSPYSQPPADDACRGKVTTTYLDVVKVLTVTPTGCGALVARRLIVAGDSHAGAYLRMLRLLAQREHFQVLVYASPGCAFMDLLTPVSSLDEACAASHKVMQDHIVADAQPRDTVFLPSLRMTRYLNQDGSLADDATAPSPAAFAETKAFVTALSARHVDVVLEAPKPVFKAPPFRCADWFDRTNPICAAGFAVPRETFEHRRAAILAEEHNLARAYPGVSVWDPAAVLCGKDACDAFKGGKPLFFDGDHLSGYADDILLQSFATHLNEADAPRPDDAAAR